MKTHHPKSPRSFLLAGSLLMLASACGLKAGTGIDTWSGGGADNNWNTAGNWTAGSANQPPLTGDSLYFDGLVRLTANNNDTGFTFTGLTFNPTAGAFTLTGNSLTLGAGVTNKSPNLETINLPVALSASQSVYVTGGGSLTFNNIISGTGYTLTKTGSGLLTLTGEASGANTYGPTAINGGSLLLDFSQGGNTPSVNIVSNAVLNLAGGTLIVNGSASASSQSFTSTTLTPVATASPGQNIVSATNGAGTATINLGAITLNSGNSIVFNGPATIGAKNVAVTATGVITTTSQGAGPTTAGVDGIVAFANANNTYGTVGLYDWASTDLAAGGGAGTSPYTIIGGSQVTGFYNLPGNNAGQFTGNDDFTVQQTPALGGTSNVRDGSTGTGTAYSIRYNSPIAPYATIKSGNFMEIGGILITPNMGYINAGLDQIRLANQVSQIVQNNTSAVFSLGLNGDGPIFANDSQPAEGFVKSGNGTLFLNPGTPMHIAFNYTNGTTLATSSSTYYDSAQAGSSTWGAFYLNSGVTVINNANVLGNPTGTQPTAAGGGGTVNLNGGTLMAATTTANAGSVNLINAASTGSASRPVFLGGNGGGLASQSGTTFTVGGVVSGAFGSGPLTIGIPASSANNNTLGLVPGTGTGTANPAFNATGTVALTGASSYYGGTILVSGVAEINGINALGGANYGGVTFNGGTLQYASGFSGNGSGDLTSIGTAGVTVASGGGTIDMNGNSVTYAGSIGNSGSGTLAVISTLANGTLTLQGANTYTGGTTVQNATVVTGNTTGSATGPGNVTLNSGGILSGTGSIAGSVMINSGGILTGTNTVAGSVTLNGGGEIAPPGTTGKLTLGSNLAFSGGTCAVSVNAATPTNGMVIIGGNLTISSGTVQLAITGTLANGTYKIIGVPSGTITGSGGLLAISGFSQPGQDATMVANMHELDLVVANYVPKNLLWGGDGSGSGLWNLASDVDWTNTATSVASVFNSSDMTTFDDTSVNQTVNIVGGLTPGTVTINGTKSYSFTGTGYITGSTPVTNNSTGTLMILTTNAYTGGTVINSGTVQVGNGSTKGGSIGTGPVTDNGALVFDLPSGTQTVGAVSGTGTVSSSGAGTVVLNGADTLAGATIITAGVVKQGAANVLPNGAGVGDTTVNGTLDLGGQNGSINGLFGAGAINNSAASAGTLTVLGSSSVNPSTFSGLIENTGSALSLNFNGIYGNELQLNNNNTYSGGTTITAGTLQMGDTNAISGGSLNVLASGTLDLNGFSPTIDSLTGAGTVDQVSAAGTVTLTVGNANGSGTFSGVINDTAGVVNLAKNGSGTEILTGNNGFTGTVTVNNGVLALNTGGVINNSSADGVAGGASGQFVVNGGNFTTTAFNIGDPSVGLLVSAGTANITGALTLNSVGSEASSGSLIYSTGGTLNAGSITIGRGGDSVTTQPAAGATTEGIYITNGTVNVSGAVGVGTPGAANSSANLRIDTGGVMNIGGSLTVGLNNGGRWSDIDVNGGTLLVGDTGTGVSLGGTLAGNTILLMRAGLASVGKVSFGQGSIVESNLLQQTGGTLYIGSGGMAQVSTGVGSSIATINLGGGTLGASANWSSSLPINLIANNYTIQTADSNGVPYDVTLTGVVGGVANSQLTVDGGGVLTLSAPNYYDGGTVVSNSTLNINGVYALGGANYLGITLSNNATLQYAPGSSGNGSLDLTLATPTAFGSTGVWLAAGANTIDVNGNNVTYANKNGIFGGGQLQLVSTIPGGSLTLPSTNSYTAGTVVEIGATLYVNNTNGTATGLGGVTVAAGGMLAGNGLIGGPVEITYQGTNSPGNNGVGTNYMAQLQLDGNSVNNFEFTSLANDQTVVTGSGGFDVNEPFDTSAYDGAAVVFNLYQAGSTAPWTTPGTYKLIQFTGTAPSLGTSWGTVSTSNSHVGNPQPSCLYSFGISGGYLTVTITSSGLFTAATWTNNLDSTWTVAGNWNPNTVPHAAGDSATFGGSTAFRTVTLNANESVGTVSFNNANSFNIASAGHTLTLDNSGGGANVYVSGGTANSIQTAVALNDNTAVNVTGGDALSVSGSVANGPSGTKTLAVTGAGTVTLSGNNSYGPAAASGFGTTVSGPTLIVGNNNALAAGDVSVTANSTLQAGTAGLNVANNIDVGSGATVSVNPNGNTMTLGGNISDSGALTQSGAGKLVLNGNNSYSGNTTVNAGVLSIPQAVSVQNSPNIDLNGGELLGNGSFAINANIGIGPITGGTGGTGLIDVASGQTFQVNNVVGSAGNSGTDNLVVNTAPTDNGTLELSGIDTFGGSTVISNGFVDVQNTLALQNSTVNYNNQGGFLVFDSSVSAATLGGLTGTQNLGLTNLGSGGINVSIGNNLATTTYSGGFNDDGLGGVLTKVGTGALVLSGVSSIAGNTTVSGGVLNLTNNGVLDTLAANVSANGGGTELLIDGGTLVATNASTVGNPSTGLHVSSGSASFLGGLSLAQAANGAFIDVTGGSLYATNLSLGRTGLNDSTQPTAGSVGDGLYISNGVVNIAGNLNMGTASADNSSANVRIDAGSLTVGGAILIGLNNGGRWSVVDADGGTLTVTDIVTGISIGNALVGDAELLVRAGTVNAGIIGLGFGTVADTVVLNQTGGSLYVGAGGIVQVSPNATASITLDGGMLGASTNWSCTNAIQLGGTTETIQTADANGNPQNIYMGGSLSGSGPLVKDGAGTLVLSNAESLTSAVTVSNGILSLVPGASLAGTPQIAVGAGATFDVSALGGFTYTGSPVQTLAGASTSGAGTNNAPGSTVTLASGAKALLNASGGGSPTVGKVTVIGALALNNNSVTINVTNNTLGAGSYRLLDCTGSLTGTANATPTFTGLGATPGATVSVSTTGGAAGHVDLSVGKGTLVLSNAAASTITNGYALSASILTVTFTNLAGTVVPGTAAFVKPLGTIFPTGTTNLSVTFAPTDTTDYNTPGAFNVSLTVLPSIIIPTDKAGITGFSLSGTNVFITATNGDAGATYYLLTTTNLTNPLPTWKTVWTNVAGAANFSLTGTNAVQTSDAQQFYILSSTNYNP